MNKPDGSRANGSNKPAPELAADLGQESFVFNQQALNTLQTAIARSLLKLRIKNKYNSPEFFAVLKNLGAESTNEKQKITAEQFSIEFNQMLDAFNGAVSNYPGEMHDVMGINLISDFQPLFVGAILREKSFDLITIAEDLCEASNFRFNPQKILGRFLDILPTPAKLNETQRACLAKVVSLVDEIVPGTKDRMQWEWENKAQK